MKFPRYSDRQFDKILMANGWVINRYKGDHTIWVKNGRHISVQKNLNAMVARRLIKENNLEINVKLAKKQLRLHNKG